MKNIRYILGFLYKIPFFGYLIKTTVILMRAPYLLARIQRLEALLQKKEQLLETKNSFDEFYVAFEEKFRGSREEIKKRANQYLSYIKDLPFETNKTKILDIGCGRGEWLELLKENGYNARGIDINSLMVKISKDLFLDALEADAIEYLGIQKDESISCISGFHIVEHLPFELLMTLLKESHRVLQKGGMVLFETPNPENLVVGAHMFYKDMTHKNPLPPDVAQFLLEYNGFTSVQILRVNGSFDVDFKNDFLNFQFNSQFDYAVVGYKL
ncbi:MAG: class I SAM-dependent methyltransferase [Sulfurimonas sp.]|jgi:O-antigen chain-terminating methyltransferase